MGRTFGLAIAGIVTCVFVFFGLGLFSPVVSALPLFARKTGLSCSTCHEVWPRLNDFGQNFRDRGYRLKRDRDVPVEQDPAYWPLAFRTTAGYQFVRQAMVATDAGPITTIGFWNKQAKWTSKKDAYVQFIRCATDMMAALMNAANAETADELKRCHGDC